ncbi:MAG: hypothetical protein HYY37_04700 [Candidatus Aenigmarchaeota archaeon]|nr:hypothetical protein [Candidatus Aenigmarchaeota archaeon]
MKILFPALKAVGLTENEARAYIVLLQTKKARASDVAKAAHIPRSKMYELMERLHEKGFVEIIPEKIKRFNAVPFNEAAQFSVRQWQNKIQAIHETKGAIEAYLKALVEPQPREEGTGYFAIVRSKAMIFKKLEDMLGMAEKHVSLLINSSDMRRLMHAARRTHASGGAMHVLGPVSVGNREIVGKWMKFADVRHYETQFQMKLAIIDDKEMLVFRSDPPIALHSRDQQFIALLQTFFEEHWNAAPAAKEKMVEIETGKPIEEMSYIRGRQEFYHLLPRLYAGAQKDIVVCTTSNGLIRLYKLGKKYMDAAAARGVRIRLMAPITSDNMRVLADLANVEVRHMDKIYAVVNIFDDSFVALREIKNDSVALSEPEDMAIITSMKDVVKMMREMAERMWIDAIPMNVRIRQIETQQKDLTAFGTGQE